MKRKILSFITDGERFLALRNNPEDSKHGGDFWFVVTGSVEKNESLEDAVKREIKEETNLDTLEVIRLNFGSIYECWEGVCEEINFISFVKKGSEIILDQTERIDFEWLYLDDFIEKIRWDDDKNSLKIILEKALKKEKHLDDLEIKDYR